MTAGSLLRAYAFEVSPGQPGAVAGGEVATDEALGATLHAAFSDSGVAEASAVTFNVSTTPPLRTHPLRDAAIAIAFGANGDAAQAKQLAVRLAESMDQRSRQTLLVVSVHEARASRSRRLLLWTFPREQVFNFSNKAGLTRLVVSEAFNSQSSDLRKVAYIEGPNHAGGMLTARVLDFQTTSLTRVAAEYWTKTFLDARLQISSAEGTLLLAQAFRTAFLKTKGDLDAQDQISGAITGLRASPRTLWTLKDVTTFYLFGSAAEAFTSAARPEELGAAFEIDRPRFDALIQYRRFLLTNGIIVMVPFSDLGDKDDVSIVVEPEGTRRLAVTGAVSDEQVRSRG